MFQEARLVGRFRLIACSAGLEYMGVDSEAVEKNVDEVLGLPAIFRSPLKRKPSCSSRMVKTPGGCILASPDPQ